MSEKDLYKLEPEEEGEGGRAGAGGIRCRSCAAMLDKPAPGGICPKCNGPVAGALTQKEFDEPPAPTERAERAEEEAPPKCENCGYDLRGHVGAAKCPECGTPRKPHSKTDSTDPLYLMPREVINDFRVGTTWLFLALLGAGAVLVLMISAGAASVAALAGALAWSVIWIWSVWQVTPAFTFRQAVLRGFSEESALRGAARILQLAWPIAAGLGFAWRFLAGNTQALDIVLGVSLASVILVGLLGMFLLSILLEELSDWTRDDKAAQFFGLSQWGIGAGVVIIVAYQLVALLAPESIFARLMFILAMPAGAALVLGLVTYIYAAGILTKSVALSVVHAREHLERLARQEERRREEEAKSNPPPA